MMHQARKLGEVCQVLTGGTPSRTKLEYFGGGIPWVKITDMRQGMVVSTDESLTAAGIENSSAKLMPSGTVLISIFATIGRTAVLGIEAATNQAIAGVVPKDNAQLDSQYLRYFLDSQHGELNRVARGVAQPNINQGILKDLDVPLPPIAEQRRIVDILSCAEGIVRLRREAEKKVAELIPALFLDMFGDPATNPKGWPTAPIVEFCAVQTGGTPSRDNPSYYDGTIPWVKTGEVAGGLILKTEEHISAQALNETNCKKFPVGTILVAMYGQGQTRGRCAVLGIEASTNQACAAILPSERIAGEFLFRLLQTQYEHLRSLAQGGNQANLNLSMIKNYRVIVPPISKQNEFVERVNAVSSIQFQQATATATAQATFDSLLSQVFHAKGIL